MKRPGTPSEHVSHPSAVTYTTRDGIVLVTALWHESSAASDMPSTSIDQCELAASYGRPASKPKLRRREPRRLSADIGPAADDSTSISEPSTGFIDALAPTLVSSDMRRPRESRVGECSCTADYAPDAPARSCRTCSPTQGRPSPNATAPSVENCPQLAVEPWLDKPLPIGHTHPAVPPGQRRGRQTPPRHPKPEPLRAIDHRPSLRSARSGWPDAPSSSHRTAPRTPVKASVSRVAVEHHVPHASQRHHASPVSAMPWERGHSADVGKPVTPRISPPTRPRPALNMSGP